LFRLGFEPRSGEVAQRGLSEQDLGLIGQAVWADLPVHFLAGSFCHRCLFDFVLPVGLGWSIELTHSAQPLPLETGKSEFLGWGWLRLPEMEKLH